MSDSALAAISTLAWVALVGVLIGLFGREEGGAWSIASSVARGVRGWSNGRRGNSRDTSPSSASPSASPSSASPPSAGPRSGSASSGSASSGSAAAEVEDFGDRPVV